MTQDPPTSICRGQRLRVPRVLVPYWVQFDVGRTKVLLCKRQGPCPFAVARLGDGDPVWEALGAKQLALLAVRHIAVGRETQSVRRSVGSPSGSRQMQPRTSKRNTWTQK